MSDERKMGFNATWSMAVGGMVGGGIFSVLGVIIQLAGAWAWLSFLLAGLIALATGQSYVKLASRFGESGGAFTFLREVKRDNLAGGLSWVLVAGYVLTLAVYAFTFGHYLNAVLELGPWFARVAAAGIIIALVVVNLLGVAEASWLEIFTVWGKLVVLAGLAAFGLWTFNPEAIRYDQSDPGGLTGALVGAAAIFMAYEGFQLLTYDYDDIRDPRRTLQRTVPAAIIAVIAVYILVALGATSLVGASSMVEHKEIALADAGRAALGQAGLILVSIAAAFSTASAINATLFATARLSQCVAKDGELPSFFGRENRAGIPDRSVIGLGGLALVLAMIGDLGPLVEAASLAFLITFCIVNILAAIEQEGWALISWLGAAGAATAGVALAVRLAFRDPVALAALAALVLIATIGRPIILRHVTTNHGT